MLLPFMTRLRDERPLVCHGATGTMLLSDDDDFSRAPEMLNLNRPQQVLEVQRAWLAAGAEVLSSFSFGANPITLQRAGLVDRTGDINVAAVRLAREAAGDAAYVAGALGPTGELLEPYGELSTEEATEAYALQARALAKAGVDLFWIKTMSDLAEVRACLAGIRLASNLPVLCTMSFERSGRTMMGVSSAQAARALAELGLAGYGANCSVGPAEMVGVLREMHEACPHAALVAQPNAGLPSLEGGAAVYDIGPETFAACARRYADLGVRLIGGCCGSTPAHIAAIAATLRGDSDHQATKQT